MIAPRFSNYFPPQRVDAATKDNPSWYANCIDYIIDAGVSFNDRNETEELFDILHGNIPDRFYRKTLNPYNAKKEKYKRFPATMRNFDITTNIVRRYISEYYKGVHQFIVGADSPDVFADRNNKLREEIGIQAAKAFQQEFEKNLKQMQEDAANQGQDPSQVNPKDAIPDEETFMNNFNEKFVDKQSKQGQDLLDYVRDMTHDTLIYLQAFFNFVSVGECFTYKTVRDNKIYKECVPVTEAYPVPNNQYFVEDFDMFARKMRLSYSQIIDMFDEYLDDNDRAYLDAYYSHQSSDSNPTMLRYDQYFEHYKDLCARFGKEERDLYRRQPIAISDDNSNLYEVWHVVWRGQAKRGILTYLDPATGFQTTRVVEEDYQLNYQAGDINIEWKYEEQIYEGYRIGTRHSAIYPIKYRPVLYMLDHKLPYNGLMEVLPMMGKFSLIKTISPYQIMRNIIIYHREMVIAKNKMLMLIIPASLLGNGGDKSEDIIYKMAADGVLIVDDSEDNSGTKISNVRMLNANMGQYITELTNLIDTIKQAAFDAVDMNAQRYGQIAQSAGASTTQNAITQSSMGSVILTAMFDEFRKTDYQDDMDMAKFAYIDGLQASFTDPYNEKRHYLSLDVNSYVNADYSVTCRNDAKEVDKLQQLRQWAFSAAQNGDLDMAIAAITGDNVAKIKDLVNKFMAIKRQHENDLKQADQQLERMKLQDEIQKIQAQGEEDRKTEQLKYQYEMQLKYVDVDMSNIAASQDHSEENRNRQAMIAENNKMTAEANRNQIAREQMQVDTYNKAADRQVKREQIAAQVQIAKTNKNKYDK